MGEKLMKNKRSAKSIVSAVIFAAAAVFSVYYGMLIARIRSGTGFFMVWIALGGVLLLMAGMSYWSLWNRIPVKVRSVLLVLFCLLLGSFVVIEGIVFSGFRQHGKADLDYIIVLGAQVRQNGPSTVLRYRLDEAAEYLNENPDTICIVSGGQGPNEPFSEAEGMADYLIEKGILESRLIREDRSRTTEQNIVFSRKFFNEQDSVGIVTNNFHVFRAVQTAEYLGLKNVCGIAAYSIPFYLPNNMLREYFGELKFLCRRILRKTPLRQ